jgi:hypothetical protein
VLLYVTAAERAGLPILVPPLSAAARAGQAQKGRGYAPTILLVLRGRQRRPRPVLTVPVCRVCVGTREYQQMSACSIG